LCIQQHFNGLQQVCNASLNHSPGLAVKLHLG